MTSDTAVLTTRPSDGAVHRVGLLRQLVVDSTFVLLGFPLALAAFVVVVTGLSVGAGLLVIWVGVPVLVATLGVARGFAALERSRIPAVLRGPVPAPAYRRAPEGAGTMRRLLVPLTDLQYWLDAVHALVRLVPSTVTWSLVVTWWAGAVGGLTYGLWDWALPDQGADDQDLIELVGLESSTFLRILLYTLIGAFFALTLPFLARGCALLEAQLARLLLTSRAATQAEMGRLTEGRAAAVAAEAVALRRLERDIHDGPQQRLVRLSMDLHRAQRQVDSDPAGARATLAEAAEQTRETLEELRALSRGIAPPVLADRGLAAALAAIAARSPVPLELTVELGDVERLAPAVENTGYFVVSEALANVAKHSAATVCRVDVAVLAERLVVTVEDDGAGGAVLLPGHGLAGLADRITAADGTFTVDSPRGGPTRLLAVIPCG